MVKCGIVGLPNVGKSTLFNALLKKSAFDKSSAGQAGHAKTADYPFTTIEPNVGVVEVPDSRLEVLAEVIASENSKPEIRNPKQIRNTNDTNSKLDSIASLQNDRSGRPPIIHATVEFVDIAGLVKGAHKGEGLGNQFLSHIREVDAIVFVVRDFKNEDIVSTGENPEEDLEVLKAELLLKDLETVESQKSKVKSQNLNEKVKSALNKLESGISKGVMVKDIQFDEQEEEEVSSLNLLTDKEYLVVINCDEGDLKIPVKETPLQGVIRISAKMDPSSPELFGVKEGAQVLRISAKMEEELAVLSEHEQKEYLKEVGVERSGLERLAEAAYKLLELETFLTAGAKEVRAWTIKKGTLAPQAAGVIHTDFERGFIAADVIAFEKFVEAGGWKSAREKGWVKTIGKAEVMPEDSVVEFRFSV